MSLNVLESEDFEPIVAQDLEAYAKKLEKIDDIAAIHAATTKARRLTLPFYDNVTLIEFTDPQWLPEGVRVCFLELEGNLYRLNGTSPPIHEVNAKAPIVLNDDCLLTYLVFFCFFVRGEEGPFYILETPESGFLPDLPDSPDIFEYSRKARSWGRGEDENWRVSATVFYSNAVFSADFIVQQTGMIEMADDTPLLSDLSVKVIAPLTLEGVLHS